MSVRSGREGVPCRQRGRRAVATLRKKRWTRTAVAAVSIPASTPCSLRQETTTSSSSTIMTEVSNTMSFVRTTRRTTQSLISLNRRRSIRAIKATSRDGDENDSSESGSNDSESSSGSEMNDRSRMNVTRTVMTPSEARMLLGVEEDETDFEMIVQRKNELLSRRRTIIKNDSIASATGNRMYDSMSKEEFDMMVEEAYDVLLMKSLTMRNTGTVADPAVRYADVKRKPASDTTNSALGIRGTNDGKGKDAMETVARMVRKIDVFPFKVGVDSMSGDSALRRSVAFVSLLTLAFLNGMYTSSSSSSELDYNSIPGIEVSLALALATYFISTNSGSYSSKLLPGFFVSLTVLAGGCAVGSVVEQVLRVDIIPVFGISNPATIVAEGGISALWAASILIY